MSASDDNAPMNRIAVAFFVFFAVVAAPLWLWLGRVWWMGVKDALWGQW